MGHKESKIFRQVEEAIANQNESNTKSIEKKVNQLWKSLDKQHHGYLDSEEALEFFNQIYDFCKSTLKHEGIVFDPNLTKDELISDWVNTFQSKDGTICYDGFCLALKAVASACFKELRQKEEKDLAEAKSPVVPHSNTTHVHHQTSKAVAEVLEEEHKLLSTLQTKEKKEEKKEKKEEKKEKVSQTPSSLRRVFSAKENPILHRTFEYHFYTPKEVEHVTAAWTGHQGEANLMKLRQCIPLEYTNLGLNVIVDGIPGAGLSTIMENYCSSKEMKTDDHPLSFTECSRDLFNIGASIPIKFYKYSPRGNPTDPYIKFTSGLLVKVDLWMFVLDITKPLDATFHLLITNRIRLVTDFFKQMKLKPALLFIGSKLDEREIREYSYEDGKKLGEKYGAMYTEMSGATGMFVVRGLNAALRAAIGQKEQRPDRKSVV